MTVGKSLCYAEVDVPVVRQTMFGFAQNGMQPTDWTAHWGLHDPGVNEDIANNGAIFSSGNYLTRGAGLTSVADSKLMTFSAWVRIRSGNGGRLITSNTSLGGGGATGRTRVVFAGGTTQFQFVGINAAGAEILSITSSSLPTGQFLHLLGSVDMNNPASRHIYVNDVSDLASVNTFTNDTIDFTLADWGIAANPDGSSILTGDIAFLWFAPGVYIDFSVEANRREFISSAGEPVDLGADGSTPTGTAPRVYLAGTPISTWGTNKGTGGGFTTTGTLLPLNGESTLLGIVDEELPSGKGVRVASLTDGRTAWSFDPISDATGESASALALVRPLTSLARPALILRGSGTVASGIQGYLFQFRPDLGVIEVGKLTAGVFTSLDQDDFVPVEDELHWVRFEVFSTDTGVTLRSKAWQGELADEPEEWMASADDSSDFAAGWSGVFSNTADHDFEIGFLYIQSFEEEETFRFAQSNEYLPPEIEAIPSLQSVSYSPAVVSLGLDLGRRASVTVTLRDHLHMFYDEPYDVGTFWGKWRARFGNKLRGRSFRLIYGMLGQDLENMETRHFYLEATDGPTPDGAYQMQAQDPLKFLDDERAQAPMLSEGNLGGGIDDNDLAAVLVPTGVGSTYPASGHVCIGGKEIVSFTRSGDNLTIVRAQLGTLAQAHEAGDRVQLVLYYDGDDAADIIYDLITNYTDFDPAFISLPDWQAETAANLNVLYARVVTEPTGVNKMISELIEQAALAVAWDDVAPTLRLQVLRAIATDAALIDEDVIIENSLKVTDQPNTRISQHWTFYGQRNPTDRGNNSDNFRAGIALVDLEREGDYGGPIIKKTFGSWVPTEAAAERLNQIKLSRFRDPPRKLQFDLFRGALDGIRPLNGYRLQWRQYQDLLGQIVQNGAPIQITRVSVEPGVVRIEAEEMLASGVVVLTNVVILTDTDNGLQWEVPADWNDAANEIHVIGGGGAGGGEFSSTGGGGAAYSMISNLVLTPAAMIDYQVGEGGEGNAGASGEDGGDTWFNSTVFASASVAAKGGDGGGVGTDIGLGGLASEGIGTVKFSGGDGGESTGGDTRGCGGGGGAAGPNGDGADGGDCVGGANGGGGGGSANGGSPGDNAGTPGTNLGGDGGDNRFNFGGGTNGGPTNGTDGAGGAGANQGDPVQSQGGDGGVGEALWTQTIAPIIPAGPGGGGGGVAYVSSTIRGGHGGLYGGGGGGGRPNRSVTEGDGGNGAQGCIIIIWTP